MMHDIAVLGAGPAGLATAICCAQAGLDVRILDRSTFPRPSVGEAVHPGVEALFERLGVAHRVRKAKFVRHVGIWLERANHRQFIPFGKTAGRPWRGFQLWRPTFDQILLDRARALGCKFVAACNPSEAVSIPHGVRIVSNAGEFEAKIVVDGTGRNRWLARCWRLPIQPFSPPLIAHYEYGKGRLPNFDDNPVFHATRDGWEWTARVGKDLYQRIALRYAQGKRGVIRAATRFEGLRTVGRPRGADVTWTLVEGSASIRHFLVGDAAAVLDPSSSHGILRALSSGILAANCIAQIFRKKSLGDSVISGYKAWQLNWFLQDVNRMKTFTRTARPVDLDAVRSWLW
jgi:flavin-dependent dehydrogenase